MRSSVNRRQKSQIKSLIASNHELISFLMTVLTLCLHLGLSTPAAASLSGIVKKCCSKVCKAAVKGKSSSVSLTLLNILPMVAGSDSVLLIHLMAMTQMMLKELKAMVVSKEWHGDAAQAVSPSKQRIGKAFNLTMRDMVISS